MARFNRLLKGIAATLEDLQRAIRGEIAMSQELDNMYSSFINGQVPEVWARLAYPSLKPLFSWFNDLIKRTEFLRKWLMQGQPVAFWLPGFFFPQGFMTGVLQTFARKYKVPIDKLSFEYKVLEANVTRAPADGVYIYGLFLEGARWEMGTKSLADQLPGTMHAAFPTLHFVPKADHTQPEGTYACPVYKTSVRAGVLSTTGQSTNFVVCVDLPTSKGQDYWTLKGTAMLCQLND
eukprot:TRINITY_DN13839_c0_g7_i1.p2 TRINITY_DN13839_c0_g7~~TRINITY_DN13839_c0_g7_i1.p2  ORF type:complete len:235 (-),score=51.11 TRINITY_DN13839_c0_g7_i1:46-750(-)